MPLQERELAIVIDGKHCWLWSNSFGLESLELAIAIASQNQQVLNQSWSQLLERLPATQTAALLTEALNWLHGHNPNALEWFCQSELDWYVQAQVEAIVDAVYRQDAVRLQQAMLIQLNEHLILDLWYPRPAYADPAQRLFRKAVEMVSEHLLRRDPQLVRWFVERAPGMPVEIQQQLLMKVKLCEVWPGEGSATATASPGRIKRVYANYKRAAQDRSLAGLRQKAIAIVKDQQVLEFEFESTGNAELDATIQQDLAKVKPHVKLPENTPDGRVRVSIVFREKGPERDDHSLLTRCL